jgi:hypothetical protein
LAWVTAAVHFCFRSSKAERSCGGYIVIAEMKGGKGNLLRLFGHVGGDATTANGELCAPGGDVLVVKTADGVAEEDRLVMIVAEDRGDGVVRGHLLQRNLHRFHQAFVDVTAVLPLRAVALGLA